MDWRPDNCKNRQSAHTLAPDLFICVDSDAMLEAGIRKNDFVIAQRVDALQDGAIIVAAVDGKPVVRRYFQTSQGAYLSPDNTAYPAIEFDPKPSNIYGVVTQVIRARL